MVGISTGSQMGDWPNAILVIYYRCSRPSCQSDWVSSWIFVSTSSAPFDFNQQTWRLSQQYMDMVFTPHWNRYAMNAWTIADLLVNQVPGPRAQGSISQKRGTCTRRIDPRQWQINRLRFCHKLGNTQYTQLNVAHELPQKLRGKRPLAHSKALCWWVAVKEAASAWWSWISFGQKFPPSSVEDNHLIQAHGHCPIISHVRTGLSEMVWYWEQRPFKSG